VFACKEYNEEQRMKLAAAEFSNYALTWWNKYKGRELDMRNPWWTLGMK